MTYTQRTTPDGKHVDVTCDRRWCRVVARFLARDSAAISHWKAAHTCDRPGDADAA